jgi:SAM-dependent methyltransferase
MHDTALTYGKIFFEHYVAGRPGLTVVDIGSQDVNGSLRSVCPADVKYVGLDFEKAKGVDVVLADPYHLPLESESVDVCVTSSCFEHSEFFWLLFMEALRILKPDGLLYINAPSNGLFHQYPVDCWRFYPDSGLALQNWARRSSVNCAMLESFIGKQGPNGWNDFVSVFVKNSDFAGKYERRMLRAVPGFTNGRLLGSTEILNQTKFQEDQQRTVLGSMKSQIFKRLRKLSSRRSPS